MSIRFRYVRKPNMIEVNDSHGRRIATIDPTGGVGIDIRHAERLEFDDLERLWSAASDYSKPHRLAARRLLARERAS